MGGAGCDAFGPNAQAVSRWGRVVRESALARQFRFFPFLLESAVVLGFGKENASAVIKALEKEAGVEVKANTAS